MSVGGEDAYYTPQELAKRYKNTITLRTLANWRCIGAGPPYTKIGGRVLYLKAAVLEWEAKRVIGNSIAHAVELRLKVGHAAG